MKSASELQALLDKMTLEEKASLCSGKTFWYTKEIERLGIPSIMVTDGPHGLRKQLGSSDHVGLSESVPATCFPPAVATASTWNTALLEEIGVALGEECLQEDVAVLLGPGVNIKRSPLGGRNFEYFSEDPYLAGQMAAAWIKGVQSQGVGTSLKHFAANNQEFHRMVIDTIVDDRSLREIYLPGFEIAVTQAQPWTVMCSYNRLNGTHLSDHREMLSTILKDEWGHTGMVVTDWGAMNDRIAGIKAGLELEMPASNGLNDAIIVAAVRAGSLDQADLDRVVLRLLKLIFRSQAGRRPGFRYDADAHHELARRAAEEATVLLKNEGGLLPLRPSGKIAVIGAFAETIRYQGAGSSQIVPTRLDQPLDCIKSLVGTAGSVSYEPGYRLDRETVDQSLIEAALLACRGADSVILFAGLPALFESEGFDRDHMRLPANQLALIDRILEACPNAVLVLQNGSPVELPFLDPCQAILESYLGGQAGGSAIARVLFGLAVPGGKLAESFPVRLEDNPSHPWFPGQPRQVQYREGIWIGYRYYDAAGVPVAFPFGHGLSYTTFRYSDLTINTLNPDTGHMQLGCTITNSGQRAGWEIAQLYVFDVESTVHRPAKELKGFAKVWLEPGASAAVSFALDRRSFAFWDVGTQSWMIEKGTFRILVGASSADIRLEASIELPGTGTPAQPDPALAIYRQPAGGTVRFTDQAFAALLGRPIPQPEPVRPYHLNSTIQEVSHTLIGRFLHAQVKKGMLANMMSDSDPTVHKMVTNMIKELPLRSLVLMSGGSLDFKLVEGLLLFMNGHPLQGIKAMATRNKAQA